MTRFFVMASYDKKTGSVSYPFNKEVDLFDRPESATLGFRQVLRKCISSVSIEEDCDIAISWLERDVVVHNIYYIESEDTALAETDGSIFLVGFDLSIPDLGEGGLNLLRTRLGLNEQDAINSLIEALPVTYRSRMTNFLSHTLGFPGYSALKLDEEMNFSNHDAMIFYAYFYIGKLLLWRVRRDQADINISLRPANFKGAIFLTAIQRSRIINVERFQLTSNISNNSDVKKFAGKLRMKLNIRREYEERDQTIAAIEQQLASLERSFGEESRRRFERGVAIFSIIAVPFTVLGTFVAVISLPDDVDVFARGYEWIVSGGGWVLFAFSLAVPITIYLVSRLFRRTQ